MTIAMSMVKRSIARTISFAVLLSHPLKHVAQVPARNVQKVGRKCISRMNKQRRKKLNISAVRYGVDFSFIPHKYDLYTNIRQGNNK